jgi:hypothetical protein
MGNNQGKGTEVAMKRSKSWRQWCKDKSEESEESEQRWI